MSLAELYYQRDDRNEYESSLIIISITLCAYHLLRGAPINCWRGWAANALTPPIAC